MDYKKKYKKALERAKDYHKQLLDEDNPEWAGEIEKIFPELKESEDDRIRKALINFFNDSYCHDAEISDNCEVTVNEAIIWLEKQGQTFTKKDVDDAYLKGISDTKHELEKQGDSPIKWNKNIEGNKPQVNHSVLIKTTHGIAEGEWKGEYWYQYRWSSSVNDSDVLSWMELSDLEKQGEQKTTNKVEPKFHVGDCIIWKNHIYFITANKYRYDTIDQKGYETSFEFKTLDEEGILWDISYANYGDVLAFDNETIVIFKNLYNYTTFHSYCHIEDNVFRVTENGMPDWWEGKEFHPATKEQRDLLFKKMRETGYEWDDKNKELRKIEQSELTEFEDAVKDMMNAYRDAIGDNDVTTEEVKKHATYLLSLIPHKSTVWNEEDEKIIRRIDSLLYAIHESEFADIHAWLKSLKQRMEK